MYRPELLDRLGLDANATESEILVAAKALRSQARKRIAAAATPEAAQAEEASLAELDALLEACGLTSATHGGGSPTPTASSLSQTMLRDLPGATPMRTRSAAGGEAPGLRVPVEAGRVLSDRYELRRLLGAGGMGAVYAAFDRTREEEIALKVILPGLVEKKEARNRFLQEARVSTSLAHPGIVKCFDVGQDGDLLFLTMELLQGETLRQAIETRKRSASRFAIEEVQRIGQALCDSLGYAHTNTVHRDVKPENIFMCTDGRVLLMDFGIARLLNHTQLTMTGAAMGTAYYMAPEQLSSAATVDQRADQFSVGVVLYELLTGQLPTGMAAAVDALRKDTPKGLAQAVHRALAGRPEDRHASMTDFRTALTKGRGPLAIVQARTWAVLAGGTVLVVAGLFFGGDIATYAKRIQRDPDLQQKVADDWSDFENEQNDLKVLTAALGIELDAQFAADQERSRLKVSEALRDEDDALALKHIVSARSELEKQRLKVLSTGSSNMHGQWQALDTRKSAINSLGDEIKALPEKWDRKVREQDNKLEGGRSITEQARQEAQRIKKDALFAKSVAEKCDALWRGFDGKLTSELARALGTAESYVRQQKGDPIKAAYALVDGEKIAARMEDFARRLPSLVGRAEELRGDANAIASMEGLGGVSTASLAKVDAALATIEAEQLDRAEGMLADVAWTLQAQQVSVLDKSYLQLKEINGIDASLDDRRAWMIALPGAGAEGPAQWAQKQVRILEADLISAHRDSSVLQSIAQDLAATKLYLEYLSNAMAWKDKLAADRVDVIEGRVWDGPVLYALGVCEQWIVASWNRDSPKLDEITPEWVRARDYAKEWTKLAHHIKKLESIRSSMESFSPEVVEIPTALAADIGRLGGGDVRDLSSAQSICSEYTKALTSSLVSSSQRISVRNESHVESWCDMLLAVGGEQKTLSETKDGIQQRARDYLEAKKAVDKAWARCEKLPWCAEMFEPAGTVAAAAHFLYHSQEDAPFEFQFAQANAVSSASYTEKLLDDLAAQAARKELEERNSLLQLPRPRNYLHEAKPGVDGRDGTLGRKGQDGEKGESFDSITVDVFLRTFRTLEPIVELQYTLGEQKFRYAVETNEKVELSFVCGKGGNGGRGSDADSNPNSRGGYGGHGGPGGDGLCVFVMMHLRGDFEREDTKCGYREWVENVDGDEVKWNAPSGQGLRNMKDVETLLAFAQNSLKIKYRGGFGGQRGLGGWGPRNGKDGEDGDRGFDGSVCSYWVIPSEDSKRDETSTADILRAFDFAALHEQCLDLEARGFSQFGILDPELRLPTALLHRESDTFFSLVRPGVLSLRAPKALVGISRPYYIAQHEVTVAQWQTFADATGYKSEAEVSGSSPTLVTKDGKAIWEVREGAFWNNPLPFHSAQKTFSLSKVHPAVHLSWNDATAYCRHFGFSLPTEAQWEFACAQGQETAYWWGSDPALGKERLNGAEAGGPMTPSDTGSGFPFTDGFPYLSPIMDSSSQYTNRQNALGLVDMLGNASEWCLDSFLPYPAPSSTTQAQIMIDGRLVSVDRVDPCVQQDGQPKVLRGGAWSSSQKSCRVDARRSEDAAYRDDSTGFRPVWFFPAQ